MLSDGDILPLLGDGDVSDICSEVNELVDDNCFPIGELVNLLDKFNTITDVDYLDSETESIVEVESDFIHTNKDDILYYNIILLYFFLIINTKTAKI